MRKKVGELRSDNEENRSRLEENAKGAEERMRERDERREEREKCARRGDCDRRKRQSEMSTKRARRARRGKGKGRAHEENGVSRRHMTWWKRSWWIRIDVGSRLRSARGRCRVWRAARRAAEETRDGNWVGEVQCGADGLRRRKKFFIEYNMD